VRTPAELTDLFRARGLKVTPQRQCIFRVLHGNGVHPTAESVYAAARAEMPVLSLKTVYQTLNDLAAMGEIQLLELGTGSARFDPNIDAHHHLVCTTCGKVRDLDLDLGELVVPEARRQGFLLGTAEVVFRGQCATCTAAGHQLSNHHQEENTHA
jgi:Fur family peroxide stress response transcriptional regulator